MEVKNLTIKDGETERKFTLTPMPAYSAEQWMYRAALALGRNTEDVTQMLGGKPADFLRAILSVKYEDARPLLDDLLACCAVVNGNSMKRLDSPEACSVIQSPLTLTKLRIESLKLNFGFLFDGAAWNSLLPQNTETTA